MLQEQLNAQSVNGLGYADTSSFQYVTSVARQLYEKEDFSGSLSYYLKAASIAETRLNPADIASVYYVIGVIHARTGNYQKASEYLNTAMIAAEKSSQKKTVALIHKALGNIDNLQKRYKDAIARFNYSLNIQKELRDTLEMVLCLNNIGVTYFDWKDFENAKTYFSQAFEVLKNGTDEANIALAYLNIGICYTNIQQPDKAIPLIMKGYEVSKKINSIDKMQYALEGLSDAYAAKKDFRSALNYYKQHIALKDSIFNIDASSKIAEWEAKYQTEKKQNEIAALKLEKQRNALLLQRNTDKVLHQRQFIVFILILLFLIVLSAYILFRQYVAKEKINKSLENKNIEMKEQKLQLQKSLEYTQKLQGALQHDLSHYMQLALRRQMNPHFIFNSLNSIQHYILQNDKLSANIYLSKFSDLMRKVLENSQKEYIVLKQEIETLCLYVEMEKERFSNGFVFNFNIESDIDPNMYLVPPLILQPYVENAIWHGLMHKGGSRELSITIKKDKDSFIFSVIDNGIGRNASQAFKSKLKQEHNSLGTKITQRRAELLNSLNTTEILIEYFDEVDSNGNPTGTKVEIRMPVINVFEKNLYMNESNNHR